MVSRHRNDNSVDPLTLAMAPPPNETPARRAQRLRDEEEASAISKRIDQELKLAR